MAKRSGTSFMDISLGESSSIHEAIITKAIKDLAISRLSKKALCISSWIGKKKFPRLNCSESLWKLGIQYPSLSTSPKLFCQ